VRYQASLRLKANVQQGIAAKRASAKENDKATMSVKKSKVTYIVDSIKFGSKATEEELALDLTEDDLGTEETHKILQCKVR
jgi:hypothetical protein